MCDSKGNCVDSHQCSCKFDLSKLTPDDPNAYVHSLQKRIEELEQENNKLYGQVLLYRGHVNRLSDQLLPVKGVKY